MVSVRTQEIERRFNLIGHLCIRFESSCIDFFEWVSAEKKSVSSSDTKLSSRRTLRLNKKTWISTADNPTQIVRDNVDSI